MSAEHKYAEIAAVGALRLFMGKIVSRALGFAGGIAVIRLLGFEEYGLLNIALVLPGIVVLAGNLGIGDAMTKFLAEHNAKGELSRLEAILYSGIFLQISISSILGVTAYLVSGPFAASVLGTPELTPLLQTGALLIPGWTLYAFSQSALIGLDASGKSAVLSVVQEAFGAVLPVLMIVYGLGVAGVLLGNALSFLIPGLSGVIASFQIPRKWRQDTQTKLSFLPRDAAKVISYGVPLGISALLVSALERYSGFMMAIFVSPLEIGSYNAALFIVATLGYLTSPISGVAVPFLSKTEYPNRSYLFLVKYSSFFVLPTIALIMAMSYPLTQLAFGVDGTTSFYLFLLAGTWLSYGLGGVQYLRLFTAKGDTKTVAQLGMLRMAVAVGLGTVLIPRFAVFGVVFTIFLSEWPSYVISARIAHSRYAVENPFSKVSRLYVAALLILPSTVPLLLLQIDPVAKAFAAGLLGLFVYLIGVPVIGGMTRRDLNKIGLLFGKQPLVGRFTKTVIEFMKRFIRKSQSVQGEI